MDDFNANTPQLEVVKKWLEAHFNLDVKNAEPLLSRNYQYQAFPESPDLPNETREQYVENRRDILDVLTGRSKPTYHEVIEAPGKVIVHGTVVVTTALGDTLTYDAVIIVTLVKEDGELKISHCKDFADPQKRDAFVAGVSKVMAQRAPAS